MKVGTEDMAFVGVFGGFGVRGSVSHGLCRARDLATKTRRLPPIACAAEPEDQGIEDVSIGKVRAPRPGQQGKRTMRVPKKQGYKYVDVTPSPQLRITGGTAKGRKLKSPDVYMRPMMGKVREALYSMLLQWDVIDDGMVVDMYCGSGSVGIEALSRGMGYGYFVDFSPVCADTAQQNIGHCGFEEQGRALNCTVEQVLEDPEAFGIQEKARLITLTPPYEEVDYGELMHLAAGSPLVGEGTFLVVEYPIELGSLKPSYRHRLVGIRNRRYGRTVMAIYACQPPRFVDPRPEEFAEPVK